MEDFDQTPVYQPYLK